MDTDWSAPSPVSGFNICWLMGVCIYYASADHIGLFLTHRSPYKLQRPPPVLDALGRVISEAPPDQWAAR